MARSYNMEKLRGQGVAYTYRIRIVGHDTFNFDFQMKTGGKCMPVVLSFLASLLEERDTQNERDRAASAQQQLPRSITNNYTA